LALGKAIAAIKGLLCWPSLYIVKLMKIFSVLVLLWGRCWHVTMVTRHHHS